ncbi:hypothetical protein BCR43DRAFT_521961 [Syncephalastrum racemosum]|uniref:LAG1-DNAbind-domain-containing protein n=1 Tax=Syncephalastrum racemosum TaxID=13706 RepID=A0A1X2HNV1_SYNRA|nr:hypothetical protein BCR43DRAFT_521961 [Syncephalastrum racemosum]
MAALDTTTPTPFDSEKPTSRKRKQDFSAEVAKTPWSDYVYSSPSSPSQQVPLPPSSGCDMFDQVHQPDYDLNLDSILAQGYDFGNNHNISITNGSASQFAADPASRRHSVAVGELDYKQDYDIRRFDTDLQQLLGMPPSSWSSSSSSSTNEPLQTPQHQQQQHQQQPLPHRRTMSLRLETSLPHVSSEQSPSTPSFFSPSFLDALNADDTPGQGFQAGVSFMDSTDLGGMTPSPSASSAEFLLQHQQVPPTAATDSNTIAPSAISHPWVPPHPQDQQQQQQHQRRRSSKVKLSPSSPPQSPSNTVTSSMSSSSPSPPITPMTASSMFHQMQHPAIPEEDEDMVDHHHPHAQQQHQQQQHQQQLKMYPMDVKLSKSSMVTARMLQGANSANALRPHIQQYLLSNDPAGSGERTVMVLTSKVAQKSYGTEKRFLCPPPTTVLMGSCWWTHEDGSALAGLPFSSQGQQTTGQQLAPPRLTIHISGEQTSQNGVVEWYTSNGTVLDGPAAEAVNNSGDTTMTGKCVSKHLHINDADEKRKRVEVLVKMQLGNGLQLGTLASKGIKVISKPSKKRQSVKNMELCIHHGTTISLFNRIRSQTVSTKYLGVSSNGPPSKNANNNGTCFVARTGSWDPFVIWIVDTSRAPDITTMPRKHHPTHPHYPPPPAIALQPEMGQQPLAIHYNQAVVLQCVSTGLVSPVMVIRKVDKGSMVLGGNRVDDLSGTTGGECGDEVLGDPVSQLHKIAFQIVQDPSIAHNNKASYRMHHPNPSLPGEWSLPQSCQPITYLACLNDVVGMHKTTTTRAFLSQPTPAGNNPSRASPSPMVPSTWEEAQHLLSGISDQHVVSQEAAGKVVRKRRVSCDVAKPSSKFPPPPPTSSAAAAAALQRRRVNSLNDVHHPPRRASVSSERRGSTDNNSGDGACWTEDVSDAAVWTIVGTDCATYTFWTPSGDLGFNSPFHQQQEASAPITPFPVVSHIKSDQMMSLTGENMTRDLAVWFGDVKSPRTDYKSRESVTCALPDLQELLASPAVVMDDEDGQRKLPILLVRGDGVVYRTGKFFAF